MRKLIVLLIIPLLLCGCMGEKQVKETADTGIIFWGKAGESPEICKTDDWIAMRQSDFFKVIRQQKL